MTRELNPEQEAGVQRALRLIAANIGQRPVDEIVRILNEILEEDAGRVDGRRFGQLGDLLSALSALAAAYAHTIEDLRDDIKNPQDAMQVMEAAMREAML